MKTAFRRIVSLVLALSTVFSVCSVAFAEGETETQSAVAGFTADDYLTVDGQDIVNQNGEKIRLKGVNLGAWMIWEGWLCPYEDDLDHYTMLEELTKRFGEEKAYELSIFIWITG